MTNEVAEQAEFDRPQPSNYSLFAIVIVAVAVVGYFVGLQSPMNPAYRSTDSTSDKGHAFVDAGTNDTDDSAVIPATSYLDMSRAIAQNQPSQPNLLESLAQQTDPLAVIEISEQQKLFALATREQNRAFNGAPPTIPHPINQMTSESCMACHGMGVQTESLRISRMSHQFLANCNQCHVEQNPSHMPASEFGENTFVGLPAPTGGPRAFEGAPPMIPHSTWMRVDCMSCHGYSGPYGIRTTHPWRQNCQQCHAPSSTLDQVQLEPKQQFLPPLEITK